MNAPNANTQECAVATDVWLQMSLDDSEFREVADDMLLAAYGSLDFTKPTKKFPTFLEWQRLFKNDTRVKQTQIQLQHLASYPSKHDQRFRIFWLYDDKQKVYRPKRCYHLQGLRGMAIHLEHLVWLVFELWNAQQGALEEVDMKDGRVVFGFLRSLKGHKNEAIRRKAEALEQEIRRTKDR